jgi:hypothetical protein
MVEVLATLVWNYTIHPLPCKKGACKKEGKEIRRKKRGTSFGWGRK